MAGEINGTTIILQDGTGAIVGQMEMTMTFSGTPIDISNKSAGDFITLLDGELAGNNESAYVQAIVPQHVHAERYDATMASSRGEGWSAYPFPSSIILYEAGKGYPEFDQDEADEYFRRVNQRMAELISGTIDKWDAAGIFR